MEFILQQVADNCTDFLTFLITRYLMVKKCIHSSILWKTFQR